MIGIYKITSPSQRVYIGQSINIEKRFKAYFGLNCKGQKLLYKSFLKYGVKTHIFEVVVECIESELNILERYYQELYNCVGDKGLNLMLTETQEKRRVCSDYFIDNLKTLNKNRVWSKESKEKLANAQRKRMIGNGYKKGYKHNEEFKAKRRLVMMGNKNTLGFQHNQETKRLMSLNNSRKIIILDKNTGVFYNSIKEVADLYGYKSNTLAMKLKEYGNKKNNTQFVIT